MLEKRVFGSLARYFGLLAVVFTVMMLIPGITEGIFATPASLLERTKQLLEPLPELWLLLMPTVLMVGVLLTFSRLSIKGEIRIWRTAGASVWPFALTTGIFGALLGVIMTGPFWHFTQPKDAFSSTQPTAITYQTADGTLWMLADRKTGSTSERLHLFSPSGQVLQAEPPQSLDAPQITIGPGWISDDQGLSQFTALALNRLAPSPTNGSSRAAELAYRLSYPALLVGLGLLMLPLALSIDGQRLTLVKIVGACLLALNTLFALLTTDAMAQAGLWDGRVFYPLRAVAVTAVGILALLLVEERAA